MARFYGEESAAPEVLRLYEELWPLWKIDTCAPRLRPDWSEENRTLGQCSITAFLVQDELGGKVYGVPLPDGRPRALSSISPAPSSAIRCWTMKTGPSKAGKSTLPMRASGSAMSF